MDKLNIILFGNRNVGKTTALVELAMKLMGNPGPIAAAISALLSKPGGGYRDARLVLDSPYGVVVICTAGDTWAVSDANCDLFENSLSGKIPVYLVDAMGVTLFNGRTIRPFLTAHPAKVCVCACRPTGDNYGAIKALHFYSEKHLQQYVEQRWIKAKYRDAIATASELYDVIINF